MYNELICKDILGHDIEAVLIRKPDLHEAYDANLYFYKRFNHVKVKHHFHFHCFRTPDDTPFKVVKTSIFLNKDKNGFDCMMENDTNLPLDAITFYLPISFVEYFEEFVYGVDFAQRVIAFTP